MGLVLKYEKKSTLSRNNEEKNFRACNEYSKRGSIGKQDFFSLSSFRKH